MGPDEIFPGGIFAAQAPLDELRIGIQFGQSGAGKEAQGTGARGLRSVIETVMFEIMYELPEQERGRRYIVTPEVVRGEQRLFAQDGSAAA